MASKFRSYLLLVTFVFMSAGSFAQLGGERPRPWVSGKGYWVVESNIHTPLKHTVFFYSNDNVLMYKETLEGIKLNVERRRTKMKLKKALEASASEWHSSQGGTAGCRFNQAIVMMALR